MGEVLSVELCQTIGELEKFIAQLPYVRRPDDEITVSELCQAEDFNAAEAVKLLMNPLPSFYGHKEVVYAAFAAWVLAPKDPEARLELVGLEIKALLVDLEERTKELQGLSAIQADLISRYILPGRQFLEEIYYPLDGARLTYDYGSPTILEFYFDRQRSTFYTLCKMMACCHLLVSRNPSQNNKTPSVSRAINMVEEFADHKLSSRSAIYAEWANSKQTIALIYAASTISLDEGSLLDWFLDGAPAYDKQAEHFNLWVGRARYVCDAILSRMPQDDDIYAGNIRALENVAPISFDYPAFSDDELKRIAKLV